MVAGRWHDEDAVTTPQSRLRRGTPVWLPQGRPRRRYPTFEGRRDADIAIIGGGMTGAVAALEFAAAGASVVLLEAALVGRGSTAASSALLLQEPDTSLAQLAARYGRAAARRIWRLSHDAVRDFVAMLRRRRIACDLESRDAVYYAAHAESVTRLRREFDDRVRAGFHGEWLTPGALRDLTALPARGAIRTSGNAQFNPYKGCIGLLEAARSAGADIFERSPAVRIVGARDRVRIRTARGSLEARRVVVATGYATERFRPLAGRFRMYDTYVVATPPLGRADRREVGLGDVMIWDTERPYHYARWTPDHRLLLGGGDRPVDRRGGRPSGERFAAAARALRGEFEALLPALADVRVERAWEGLFAMTPDGLPYVGSHHRYPGHLFALGYGGNGMTFGFLAARMLVDAWRGVRSADHDLFAFGRG
jgi:glycine/D-amino acid oxidase-like deaminating enzyme